MKTARPMVAWLLPLLLTGSALAAESAPGPGGSAGAGGPPPAWTQGGPAADASPEDRRAYWRKRAAARAATADAAPGTGAGADAGHAHHAGMAMPEAERGGSPAAPAGRGAASVPGTVRPPGGADGREAVLWLTDTPARGEGRPGGRRGAGRPAAQDGHAGMGGMGDTGPGDTPVKRVWLRAGGNPLSARAATGDDTALLQGPDGTASELPVEAHGGPYNVTFPTPDQGYYNVYLVRRTVEQDTLAITAAKAEVTRSGMGHGLGKDEGIRLARARTDGRVPVEIVRERKPDEALFTRVNYGDEIAFRVLRAGRPVQNARVTFTSGRGWSNSVQSDEDGRAAFTVIRDYYPDQWRLFDKRHRETFLVAASFTAPEGGDYLGERYTRTRYGATLSGAYYPGVADYESYSDGLLIGMAGLLFTGTGVYAYRRRRVRPFREVHFHD